MGDTLYLGSELAASNATRVVKANTAVSPITFTAADEGLPAVPVERIVYDHQRKVLYAGTWLGVYYSTDAGSSWNLWGTGLPFNIVRDLYVGATTLAAGTYGRSVWEIALYDPAINGAVCNPIKVECRAHKTTKVGQKLSVRPTTATLWSASPRPSVLHAYQSLIAAIASAPFIPPAGQVPGGHDDEECHARCAAAPDHVPRVVPSSPQGGCLRKQGASPSVVNQHCAHLLDFALGFNRGVPHIQTCRVPTLP